MCTRTISPNTMRCCCEPWNGRNGPQTHPGRFCGEVARGLEEDDAPAIFLLTDLTQEKVKYKMNIGLKVRPKAVAAFYQDFQNGRLDPYLISEEEPEH